MFCMYCGHQNSPNSKFCGNCGKPIAAPIATENKKLFGWIPKSASAGAALVIVCFFLPWIMVSCGGMSVTQSASGWDIASGSFGSSLNQYNYAASGSGGYPALFLILLIGVTGLISLNGKKSGSISALVSGILGILGMIIFSTDVSSQKAQMEYIGFQLHYLAGYYGSWLGFIILTVLGWLGIQQTGKSTETVSYPTYQSQ